MNRSKSGRIAKTGVVRALGAMSGTSLDGVDAAVICTDGVEITGFEGHAYRAYSAEERRVIASGFGKWVGPEVAAAAHVVEAAHIEVLTGFEGVDLIGFHGQHHAHMCTVSTFGAQSGKSGVAG